MRFSVEGVLNVLKAMLEAMADNDAVVGKRADYFACNCYSDGIL